MKTKKTLYRCAMLALASFAAHAEMIEALYREMIRRFVDMEMREFEGGTASAQ